MRALSHTLQAYPQLHHIKHTHTCTHAHTTHSMRFKINLFSSSVQKELRQVKNDISQQSKRNFELENDLRFFDSKIAHLINHRITVEVS